MNDCEYSGTQTHKLSTIILNGRKESGGRQYVQRNLVHEQNVLKVVGEKLTIRLNEWWYHFGILLTNIN